MDHNEIEELVQRVRSLASYGVLPEQMPIVAAAMVLPVLERIAVALERFPIAEVGENRPSGMLFLR